MSTVTAPRLMTNAELLAIPDDGMERNLIRGVLKEKPMTRRNRFHSSAEANLAYLLNEWRSRQPPPRGVVLSGEAGVYLSRNPDATFGIDVAYISAETAATQTDDSPMALVEGVPILAVEILSPNDTVEEINDKIDAYIAAGVKQVWIVDPHFRTVYVHRPGRKTEFYTDDEDLTAEPDLPGFCVRVASLFE